MRLRGRTLFTIVDTPGFEDAGAMLAWLTERETTAAERSDLVRKFVETFSAGGRFSEECQRLAPIIAGAGLKQSAGVVRDFADGRLGGEDAAFFAVGFAVAAVVGYASMKFLLHFLSSHRLNAFAAYRVGLGLLVFAMLGWNLIAMTRLL